MKPEYARTTITVPWKLKQQMKRVGNQVNWSAVACDAFEEKLEEMGPFEEIISIGDALKRMQAIESTADEIPNQAADDGLAVGKKWALNFATPSQLRNIEALKTQVGESDDGSWEEFMGTQVGRRKLAKCILSEDQRSHFADERSRRGPQEPHPDGTEDFRRRGRGGRRRNRKNMFEAGPEIDGPNRLPEMMREMEPWEIRTWRTILTERPQHPKFFHGFANGALKIWDELKGKF